MTMETDRYKTIKSQSEGLYKEKGSKFIALAIPVNSIAEFNLSLEKIKKQYHDARHHCYAYRIGHTGDTYRMNDDGEPSGTAGKPIYNQLLSHDLTNILIVVVRYFGGIRLGTGGLVRAYKTAAQDALANAKTVVMTVTAELQIRFPYPLMNDVMRLIHEEDCRIEHQEFTDECLIRVSVPMNRDEATAEKFKSL
jgi:uncharacterized YigZ family protein